MALLSVEVVEVAIVSVQFRALLIDASWFFYFFFVAFDYFYYLYIYTFCTYIYVYLFFLFFLQTTTADREEAATSFIVRTRPYFTNRLFLLSTGLTVGYFLRETSQRYLKKESFFFFYTFLFILFIFISFFLSYFVLFHLSFHDCTCQSKHLKLQFFCDKNFSFFICYIESVKCHIVFWAFCSIFLPLFWRKI